MTGADVVVVGGGVVGLACAIRLLERGARVSVLAAAEPAATTSAVAAAVWYPTGTTDADPRVVGWARRGFDALAAHAAEGAPGVVMRDTRMVLRTATAQPWWAPAVPDLRTVGNPLPEWHFRVPTADMRLYLPWLEDRVRGGGGVIHRRRVASLAEVTGAPVIVNATGLAARELAGDPAVTPIRGRVVVVENPGITVSVRDEANPAGTTYVHPRAKDVVLGGTYEPGESDLTPDRAVSRAIVARCTALVPELAGARVLAETGGLRPGRVGGARLEAIERDDGVRVIHDYGHGGAGVTLAWGCADDVADLAGIAS